MSIKSKFGWILLSSASLAAMGTMSPALAQDVSDEIVVTATGRARRDPGRSAGDHRAGRRDA